MSNYKIKLLFVAVAAVLFIAVLLSVIMPKNDGKGGSGPTDMTTVDVTAEQTSGKAEVTATPETTGAETVPETTVHHIVTTSPETTVSAPETTVPETTLAPLAPDRVTGISLSMYEVILYPAYTQMPWVTMFPETAANKGEIWVSSDPSVATVDMYGNITGVSVGKCTVTVTSADNPAVSATVNVSVIADVEPTYIDGILVVNKTYALPKSYAPGWDAEASSQLWTMFADAKNQGINLWVNSGYRSYTDQYIIYHAYVAEDGQANADRYSARPGHSEHQTGLAFDLNDLKHDFGDTVEGKWLADNCHKYGFILRYPKEKESITGYIYEPWHIRYLGVQKATEVYESGLCLEEFLGITSSYAQ